MQNVQWCFWFLNVSDNNILVQQNRQVKSMQHTLALSISANQTLYVLRDAQISSMVVIFGYTQVFPTFQ